jgi:hypothetical protein
MQESPELHKIDIHRLLDKIRNIYDDFLKIDSAEFDASKTNKTQEIIKEEKTQEERNTHLQEAPEKKQEKERKTEGKKELSTKEKKEEGEEKSPPLIIENEKTESNETHKKPEVKNDQPENKNNGNGGIVADKYQNTKTFRHDDLAKKQTKTDLSSRMQKKPIYDLTRAIGVNDKFSFIRELFNGDKQQYHESIQIINEMPNFEEAKNYIEESFNWDHEDPEVKRFMELVERKFTAGK